MVAGKESPRITLDEYRAMERESAERHEFIDGHVYAMSGGTRLHSILGRNIVALLMDSVGDGPCEVYNADMRVRLSDAVEVYPDATVTCDERDRVNGEDDEIAYPRLVVEVLSSGTERIDRDRKLRDYQACPTIDEYVLVNSTYQAVEVYARREETWTYQRYEAGETVELTSIGVALPLADLYQRTNVSTTPTY